MSLTLRHRKYVQRRRRNTDSRLSANASHPPNHSAHVYLEYVSHLSQSILRTWYFVHRIDRSPLRGNYSLGLSHWSVALNSPTDDTSGIHTGTVPNTTTKDRPTLFSGGNPSSLFFFFLNFLSVPSRSLGGPLITPGPCSGPTQTHQRLESACTGGGGDSTSNSLLVGWI